MISCVAFSKGYKPLLVRDEAILAEGGKLNLLLTTTSGFAAFNIFFYCIMELLIGETLR